MTRLESPQMLPLQHSGASAHCSHNLEQLSVGGLALDAFSPQLSSRSFFSHPALVSDHSEMTPALVHGSPSFSPRFSPVEPDSGTHFGVFELCHFEFPSPWLPPNEPFQATTTSVCLQAHTLRAFQSVHHSSKRIESLHSAHGSITFEPNTSISVSFELSLELFIQPTALNQRHFADHQTGVPTSSHSLSF